MQAAITYARVRFVRIAISGSVLLGAGSLAETAHACGPVPAECFAPEPSQVVATQGVVAFGPLVGSAGTEIVATATRGDGTVLEGELLLRSFAQESIWVWQPTMPLTDGDAFSVEVTSPGQWDCFSSISENLHIEVEVQDVALETLVVPTFAAAFDRYPVQAGRLVCCNRGEDSCGPNITCQGEVTLQRPRIAWTPEPLELDPRVASNFVREYFRVDPSSSDEPVATQYGLKPAPTLSLDYSEVADEYCVRIDTISLVDETRTSEVQCAPDPGLDWSSSDNDLEEFAERCKSGAYWEDDNSDYPSTMGGTGSSGGDDGESGEAEAEAGTWASAGESSGAPDRPAQDSESSGCACRATPSSSMAGAWWLIIPLWIRRRRRSN